MKLILKCIITLILCLPVLFLTLLIWVFGGWTQGFDYMPNPLSTLFDWLDS